MHSRFRFKQNCFFSLKKKIQGRGPEPKVRKQDVIDCHRSPARATAHGTLLPSASLAPHRAPGRDSPQGWLSLTWELATGPWPFPNIVPCFPAQCPPEVLPPPGSRALQPPTRKSDFWASHLSASHLSHKSGYFSLQDLLSQRSGSCLPGLQMQCCMLLTPQRRMNDLVEMPGA